MAGKEQEMVRERPLRPAARRTDCPCSSGRRHFATLAQIIRVNLDAKMAGFHRRNGGAQIASHDWITASSAGTTKWRMLHQKHPLSRGFRVEQAIGFFR